MMRTSGGGDDAQFDALRERLREAQRLLVLSGAGMSAESGIPTFRDALTGLWSRFDPAQLASVEGFRADPALVWDWYAERRLALRRVQPNAGHLALAEFARRRPGVLTIVSQNVDDLHQRAGNPDTIRLHGELLADCWLERCPRSPVCDTGEAEPGRPPRCSRCGNLVRPAVVWFGEMLPAAALDAAEQAARSCDVALIVGTSGAVWPAAGLATLARRSGAHVVIVNPHDSEIDDQAHVVLRATAAQALPQLLARD
ncbi:MAG TPA: NAD-dependent deacylase [Burkholderiaceae bacterium]|nr:NAD-dependent deacylase [Burkholderiaceae bacterium]